jgi:proline iminopeptidase
MTQQLENEQPLAGRLVEANNRTFWVEEEGSGEPLILLAGGPAASHLIFQPYFSAFADKFRVIYYDYFGRGRSGRPSSYEEITFAGDVEDLEALRQALGLERISLYGFSYGGLVAQGYALKYGAHLSALILANTLHSPEMWQKNHENINREISNQYPETWDKIVALRQQGFRSSDPEMRQLFASVPANALLRFHNPANAAELLNGKWAPNLDLYFEFVGHDVDFFIGNALGALPDFRPRLKELKMPVLILAGRYDRALYPRYQLEFKQYCPQANFMFFEHSGSFIHIEETAELLATLNRFFAQAGRAMADRAKN